MTRPVSPEAAWQVFKYVNAVSAEDPHASFLAGFHRAYRDSVSDQVEFGGLQATLERLLAVLEELRIDRDVVRTMARSL